MKTAVVAFLAITILATFAVTNADNDYITCPPVVSGTVGNCHSYCTPLGLNCGDDEKCCSNGCGHFCYAPPKY